MNTAARILIGIGMLFLSGMTDMLQAAEQARANHGGGLPANAL